MSSYPKMYRGYEIGPAEMGMWSWVHVDYDGPEDRRCGIGKDEDECRREVDWLAAELADARLTKIAEDIDGLSTQDEASATAIRELLQNVSTATLLKIADELADFSIGAEMS